MFLLPLRERRQPMHKAPRKRQDRLLIKFRRRLSQLWHKQQTQQELAHDIDRDSRLVLFRHGEFKCVHARIFYHNVETV